MEPLQNDYRLISAQATSAGDPATSGVNPGLFLVGSLLEPEPVS